MTCPVRCAPDSIVKFPSMRTSPLKRPAIRTLPDPSILPSITRPAAITDSPPSTRSLGLLRGVLATLGSTDGRSGAMGARAGLEAAEAGVLVSFQSAIYVEPPEN